ncbi:hypothetical protein KCU93_g536, partial [Aureobasidium melanogenum]
MYDPVNGTYALSDSDISPPSLDEADIPESVKQNRGKRRGPIRTEPIDQFLPVSGRRERPSGVEVAAAFGLRPRKHNPFADEKNDTLAGEDDIEINHSPSPFSRPSTLPFTTEHKKRKLHESASDEADDDGDDEQDDEEPENYGGTASPYWDPISKRVITHISFEGLCTPWRTHIRRNVLYKQKLSDLRQYYTTYRQWGKLPKKKEDVIEAILEKEKEALAD